MTNVSHTDLDHITSVFGYRKSTAEVLALLAGDPADGPQQPLATV